MKHRWLKDMQYHFFLKWNMGDYGPPSRAPVLSERLPELLILVLTSRMHWNIQIILLDSVWSSLENAHSIDGISWITRMIFISLSCICLYRETNK